MPETTEQPDMDVLNAEADEANDAARQLQDYWMSLELEECLR